MGNQQIYPKRANLLCEHYGLTKSNCIEDDGKRRIVAKSAPPFNDKKTKIPIVDCSLVTLSTNALPLDRCATVTGTFNNWTEQEMTRINGQYQLDIPIPYGSHYYRILVNGRARFQPNEMIEDHRIYGRVHFLYVESADQCVQIPLERTVLSLPKLNHWSQDVDIDLKQNNHETPPRIPPHLLNILLNQKLPANCDPTILPEPSTVMLGHLYALSIQNGLMILSTTVRYKQKFVTLCFYKPN